MGSLSGWVSSSYISSGGMGFGGPPPRVLHNPRGRGVLNFSTRPTCLPPHASSFLIFLDIVTICVTYGQLHLPRFPRAQWGHGGTTPRPPGDRTPSPLPFPSSAVLRGPSPSLLSPFSSLSLSLSLSLSPSSLSPPSLSPPLSPGVRSFGGLVWLPLAVPAQALPLPPLLLRVIHPSLFVGPPADRKGADWSRASAESTIILSPEEEEK